MNSLLSRTWMGRSLLGAAIGAAALLALCSTASAAPVRCKHFSAGGESTVVCQEPGARTTPVYGAEKDATVAAVFRKLHFNGTATPYRVRRCWSVRAYDQSWVSVSIKGPARFCEPTTGPKRYDWQPVNLIVHHTRVGWRLQYAFDETNIRAAMRAGVPKAVFYGLGFASMS